MSLQQSPHTSCLFGRLALCRSSGPTHRENGSARDHERDHGCVQLHVWLHDYGNDLRGRGCGLEHH